MATGDQTGLRDNRAVGPAGGDRALARLDRTVIDSNDEPGVVDDGASG